MQFVRTLAIYFIAHLLGCALIASLPIQRNSVSVSSLLTRRAAATLVRPPITNPAAGFAPKGQQIAPIANQQIPPGTPPVGVAPVSPVPVTPIVPSGTKLNALGVPVPQEQAAPPTAVAAGAPIQPSSEPAATPGATTPEATTSAGTTPAGVQNLNTPDGSQSQATTPNPNAQDPSQLQGPYDPNQMGGYQNSGIVETAGSLVTAALGAYAAHKQSAAYGELGHPGIQEEHAVEAGNTGGAVPTPIVPKAPPAPPILKPKPVSVEANSNLAPPAPPILKPKPVPVEANLAPHVPPIIKPIPAPVEAHLVPVEPHHTPPPATEHTEHPTFHHPIFHPKPKPRPPQHQQHHR